MFIKLCNPVKDKNPGNIELSNVGVLFPLLGNLLCVKFYIIISRHHQVVKTMGGLALRIGQVGSCIGIPAVN